jgi:2-isopropylmalate synthase
MKDKIIFFDTTLRDGEQSPGASLGVREKLEIAHQLKHLGVDVIEAGFPIASPGDFEAVKLVAQEVKGPIVCGLARAVEKDIDRAAQAVKYSKHPRIHVFLATSKIHMKYKLKKPEDEILRLAVQAVKYAKKFVKDIEFSPEDATRTDPEFLRDVVSAVIKAGATTVNIPDTVGYTIPSEYGNLIKWLKENTPGIDDIVISVHCHNDLGLAVSNSLSAILSGARQVECTMNGIGERAGNASLEEIVMAIKTRKDMFKIGTNIDTKQIIKTSRLVTRLTGVPIQPNKAIVGENAFAHESGIHQDGILKKRTTYEIMNPSDIGLKEGKLVLGKHSGRHAFKERLVALGHTLNDSEINKAFERFKVLTDKKKNIYDEDIESIVEEGLSSIPETFQLVYFNVTCGNCTVPTATVQLKKDEKIFQDASSGDGPIDAAYKTIDRITGLSGKLLDYNIKAVTGGQDALGEVNIKVCSQDGRIATGRGSSTDIIEASVKAYLNAINKIVFLSTKSKIIKLPSANQTPDRM